MTGLVDNPLNLSLSELKTMPVTTENATLYCVDFPGVPVMQGTWVGVKLSYLLEQARVQSGAFKIAFQAVDNYSTDLSLQQATQDNVILAYENNEAPLAETLRLVIPNAWGYKWISQVTRITLVDYDFLGSWESKGYPDLGIGLSSEPWALRLPTINPFAPNQTTNPTIPSTTLTPTATPFLSTTQTPKTSQSSSSSTNPTAEPTKASQAPKSTLSPPQTSVTTPQSNASSGLNWFFYILPFVAGTSLAGSVVVAIVLIRRKRLCGTSKT